MFTVYHSDFIGNPGNCSYPHKVEITNSMSLAAAVGRDYVCAEYKNNYRNGDNFIGSDCLPVDCDNDHSENPQDWVLPADVMETFPGVTFAVHYSRSNMREKNGKPARPKFHVLFPIDHVTDAACYSDMKKLVNAIFPYFDTKALDAARFFFGTNSPEVEIYEGSMNLSGLLEGDDFDADMTGGHRATGVIPEGSRNATMSRFAGRVIKKYGDDDTAYQCFLEEAAKCSPPLEEQELLTIWRSAQRFFAKLQQQDDYIPPEVYNDPTSYQPGDYSDVGQAEVLAKYFSSELRYSPATHFIRYNEHYWQESDSGAQAVAHELTRRQLDEATDDLQAAMKLLTENGGKEILENASKAKAESLMNDTQLEAYRAFLAAKAYQSFSIRRRDSKNITATLKESHPNAPITDTMQKQLDEVLTFEDLRMDGREELGLGRTLRENYQGENGMQASDVPEPDDGIGLVIEMPLSSFTDTALDNLERLVESKASLIKKALDAETLEFEVTDDKVRFPWFEDGTDPDAVKAYIHFVTALCEMAKTQQRVNATEKQVENEKYAFRCFLLRLGFIGAEYKEERKILLRNLSGSSAFKSGESKRREKGFSQDDLDCAKDDPAVRDEIKAILGGADNE